jgi:hypothetical protein
MECGKKLGIIKGYRHPTMGKDYLLCSKCFDTVSASVEKWSKFISPYVGFFNKKSSTINYIEKIKENFTKSIKRMQNRARNVWSHKPSQNAK